MKGRWESNINIWFRFMYSQKWTCMASLFLKQNYNVLSPNFHIYVSVSDLYIPRIGLPIFRYCIAFFCCCLLKCTSLVIIPAFYLYLHPHLWDLVLLLNSTVWLHERSMVKVFHPHKFNLDISMQTKNTNSTARPHKWGWISLTLLHTCSRRIPTLAPDLTGEDG